MKTLIVALALAFASSATFALPIDASVKSPSITESVQYWGDRDRGRGWGWGRDHRRCEDVRLQCRRGFSFGPRYFRCVQASGCSVR